MARFLVILLIMLLPLRGWTAERMAVQMAHAQAVAEAMDLHPAPVDMPLDCPMMQEPDKSLTGCQSCQLCMAMAGLSDLMIQVPMVVPPEPPVALNVSFVSADPKRLAKTPIL
jgi:hypothetical protein